MCEQVLDTISSHFNAKSSSSSLLTPREVTSAVLAFALPRLAAPSWLQRRAAATALFIIVESCNTVLLASLETLTTQLHPLLRDPCPSVSQKATYFFTECFDYIPGPLMAACPWLVGEVGEVCAEVMSDAQMISTNDVSIMNNGLLILESLSLELENDEKDSLLTIVVGASGEHPP